MASCLMDMTLCTVDARGTERTSLMGDGMHDHLGATLSRRRFLRWTTTGLTVGTVSLPLILAACAPTAPQARVPAPGTTTAAKGVRHRPGSASSTAGAVSVRPPETYVPFQKDPRPICPATPAASTQPSSSSQPAARSVPTPPRRRDGRHRHRRITYAPPPPVDQNAAWQAVNKSLNVNLKLQMVPTADYAAAVNVIIAGADLPDYIYNPTTTQPLGVLAALPQFARSKCAD